MSDSDSESDRELNQNVDLPIQESESDDSSQDESLAAPQDEEDDDDSSSSSSSDDDDDRNDDALELGDNLENNEDDSVNIANILDDPVFKLIQQQIEDVSGGDEQVSLDDLLSNEDEEVNEQQDIRESNDNPRNAKRSVELLYLDPEEQDPFLVNKSNRKWKKPNIGKTEASDLLDRVKSFLPQLEAANAEIQEKINAGENLDIEEVAEDGQYVEMNLSLGLLEEQEGEAEATVDSNSDVKQLIQLL